MKKNESKNIQSLQIWCSSWKIMEKCCKYVHPWYDSRLSHLISLVCLNYKYLRVLLLSSYTHSGQTIFPKHKRNVLVDTLLICKILSIHVCNSFNYEQNFTEAIIKAQLICLSHVLSYHSESKTIIRIPQMDKSTLSTMCAFSLCITPPPPHTHT